MKAIINGRRYDTDKAVEVGGANNLSRGASSVTDFSYWSATLYRTPRSGRYFLAGRGGPMTRWSRSVDHSSWTGGSGIIPLDRDEALEWAEQHLTTEEVEAGFGAEIEDA